MLACTYIHSRPRRRGGLRSQLISVLQIMVVLFVWRHHEAPHRNGDNHLSILRHVSAANGDPSSIVHVRDRKRFWGFLRAYTTSAWYHRFSCLGGKAGGSARYSTPRKHVIALYRVRSKNHMLGGSSPRFPPSGMAPC